MAVPGYRSALEELYRLRRFGLAPGLETIRAVLAELGNPEEKFPAVHITGSKGKGSVAAMTAAILTAHGHRTGLYTSPHLVRYRERARVDGVEITPAEVVEGLSRVTTAVRALTRRGALERSPTFFETTTALAYDWFARSNVTAGVVEVGIGGRWDATNVLRSRVGVVTTLELEHTEVLGPTLEAIASEKAGIFHPGMKGVLGALPPSGRRVIEAAASRGGVPLWHLDREITVRERVASPRGQTFTVCWPTGGALEVHLPLFGRFQSGNAAMAVAAAALFLSAGGDRLKTAETHRALSHVKWRGRMQKVARRPPTYYDVAHTPESAAAVAESVAEMEPFADPKASAIVFGCLEGKNAGGMFSALQGLARTVILVPVSSQRGRSPASLRALALPYLPRVVLAPTAEQGMQVGRVAVGPSGVLVVVGSDYLIGELLRQGDPQADEEPDLSDPGTMGPVGSRGGAAPMKRPVEIPWENVLDRLSEFYGRGDWRVPYLRDHAENPFQVLIGTILSQRTRDEATDLASAQLFARYPTPEALAVAPRATVERLIRPTGFYRTKSKVIRECARAVLERWGGEVPRTLEELVSLPGVGPKTANCVLVFGYGIPAIPVDTHVHRIANRLGVVRTRTPEETEEGLAGPC